jgi:nucleoside 2-deoxyribosyltransferase
MKQASRTYTVYFGGELFSLKHLAGNAALAAAIHAQSRGRFRCVLPQDFVALRGRSSRAIRDHSLRALVGCDLAMFNFDGTDLDSGTIVEFMYAKFADIPAVVLRTDIRNAGDHRDLPWNSMASYFPRTVTVVVPSLFAYRGALQRPKRHAAGAEGSVAGQDGVGAAEFVTERIARECMRGLERVLGERAVLPRRLREDAYDWLRACAGLAGKPNDVRREFRRQLQHKVGAGLL